MTALNLTRVKEQALTAKGMPGGGGKMSPDLVLELVARLERLQDQADALHQVGHALSLPAGSDVTRDVLKTVHHMEANEVALRARLEQAQAMLEISHSSNVPGALKIVMSMRDGDLTYFAGRHVLPETLRSVASDAIDLVRMEAGRTYQQLQGHIGHAAMPDDPLDDVLPLALHNLARQRSYTTTPDWAKRVMAARTPVTWPPMMPTGGVAKDQVDFYVHHLGKPWQAQADSEGGDHD